MKNKNIDKDKNKNKDKVKEKDKDRDKAWIWRQMLKRWYTTFFLPGGQCESLRHVYHPFCKGVNLLSILLILKKKKVLQNKNIPWLITVCSSQFFWLKGWSWIWQFVEHTFPHLKKNFLVFFCICLNMISQVWIDHIFCIELYFTFSIIYYISCVVCHTLCTYNIF